MKQIAEKMKKNLTRLDEKLMQVQKKTTPWHHPKTKIQVGLTNQIP